MARRLTVVALLCLVPAPAGAWDATGHRTVALIAARALAPVPRHRAAVLIRRHPAAHDLWRGLRIDPRGSSQADRDVAAFLHASTFPDDVRPPSLLAGAFHHPAWHYTTYRLDAAGTLAPPAPRDDLIAGIAANLATVRDPGRPEADRAIALCWLIHQMGDLHQPLHCVSRFDAAHPGGDHGGNAVALANPRGADDLHAYWDDLLGGTRGPRDFAALAVLAEAVAAEHPRASFPADELATVDPLAIAREGAVLARGFVYRDPGTAGYEAWALTLARRRAALAGYRLARLIEGLFPGE